MTRRIWAVAVALLVLAGLSGAALTLGRGGEPPWPSARNPRPTGLAALVELLEADGYEVVVTRDARPSLKKADLAVAIKWQQDTFWTEVERQRERQAEESADEVAKPRPDRTRETLDEHLVRGGRMVRLWMPSDLASDDHLDSGELEASWTVGDKPFSVTFDPGRAADIQDGAAMPAKLRGMAGELLELHPIQAGLRADVTDALGATNRYIGRADNAAFYVGLVRRLAQPGGRIVFVEASFGNVEAKGVLGTLGAWAVAAQWQAVLAFLVALIVFGSRFGLPSTDAVSSRGARDMLDAVAGILRRSRKPGFAAAIVARSVIEEARQRLALSPATTDDEILARFEPDLSAAVWHALQDEDGRDVARSVELTQTMLAAADRARFRRK